MLHVTVLVINGNIARENVFGLNFLIVVFFQNLNYILWSSYFRSAACERQTVAVVFGGRQHGAEKRLLIPNLMVLKGKNQPSWRWVVIQLIINLISASRLH
jgi:hypothetical protein